MPWVFGREVVTVNWLSPVPVAPGVRRDPQVAILELEGGALVFVELFMAASYGYEIRCEIVGEKVRSNSRRLPGRCHVPI